MHAEVVQEVGNIFQEGHGLHGYWTECWEERRNLIDAIGVVPHEPTGVVVKSLRYLVQHVWRSSSPRPLHRTSSLQLHMVEVGNVRSGVGQSRIVQPDFGPRTNSAVKSLRMAGSFITVEERLRLVQDIIRKTEDLWLRSKLCWSRC